MLGLVSTNLGGYQMILERVEAVIVTNDYTTMK